MYLIIAQLKLRNIEAARMSLEKKKEEDKSIGTNNQISVQSHCRIKTLPNVRVATRFRYIPTCLQKLMQRPFWLAFLFFLGKQSLMIQLP